MIYKWICAHYEFVVPTVLSIIAIVIAFLSLRKSILAIREQKVATSKTLEHDIDKELAERRAEYYRLEQECEQYIQGNLPDSIAIEHFSIWENRAKEPYELRLKLCYNRIAELEKKKKELSAH